MTTQRLASLLCLAPSDAEAWLAIRPDEKATPERDAAIKEAFSDVGELRKQRDGLIEIWPDRADRWRRECDAAILDVAVRLQERLEITP